MGSAAIGYTFDCLTYKYNTTTGNVDWSFTESHQIAGSTTAPCTTQYIQSYYRFYDGATLTKSTLWANWRLSVIWTTGCSGLFIDTNNLKSGSFTYTDWYNNVYGNDFYVEFESSDVTISSPDTFGPLCTQTSGYMPLALGTPIIQSITSTDQEYVTVVVSCPLTTQTLDLYRKDCTGTTWTLVGTTTSINYPSYTTVVDDGTAIPQKCYDWKVEVSNEEWESESTETEFSIDITGPILNSGVDGTSIELDWIDSNLLDRTTEVWENHEGGSWYLVASGITGTTYTSTGLTSGDTYCHYVRVALDDFIPVVYGDNSNTECNTLADLVRASGVTLTNVGVTGMTINWINMNTSNVVGNYIQQWNGSNWVTIGTAASGATSFDITGLTPLTEYMFRVTVYNLTYENPSYAVTDTTTDPTPIITDSSTVYNTVTLEWEYPDPAFGESIQYYYRVSGDTAWSSYGSNTPPATYTGKTFMSLTYGVCWEFMVAVKDFDTTEYESETIGFCIEGELPWVRTDSITGVTYSSANGGGTVLADGNSIVTSRGIVWATHNDPTTSDNINTDSTGGLGTFRGDLSALVPNITYYVRAYATNAIGTAYGRNMMFTTRGLDLDTFLRFEDGIIGDMEIKDFEVNYQLNDIKNVADSKTSFTMPIKLPYTPDVVDRFTTLFNVNNISDITDQRVDCKLVYKNHVIIDGYLYVEDWDLEYINAIIARNDIGIFELMRNKSLADLDFSGSTYEYTQELKYTRVTDDVDDFSPMVSGYTDHKWVWIDWLDTARDGTTNVLKTSGQTSVNRMANNYRMTPVLKVKTIFDKIFEEKGYTYSGSTLFNDRLENLYMTTNVPEANYCEDVESLYLFQEGTAGTSYKPLDTYDISGKTYTYMAFSAGTSMILGNELDTVLAGGSGVQSFEVPLFQGYEHEITTKLYAIQSVAGTNGTINIKLENLYIDEPDNINNVATKDTVDCGKIIVTGTSAGNLYENTINFTNTEFNWFSKYRIIVEYEDCTPYLRNEQAGYENSGIYILTKNYPYFTGTSYTFNNLLPVNYLQKNLVLDLIKSMNLYVYADDDDKTLIHFKDFDDFYINDVIDWTKKLTLDDIKFNDTSRELFIEYEFKSKLGGDSIAKGYSDSFGNTPNFELLYNDNEISIKPRKTIETQASGLMLNSGFKPSVNNDVTYYPMGSYFSKGNDAVTFCYLNKFTDLPHDLIVSPEWYSPVWGFWNNYSLTKIDQYLTVSPFEFTGTSYQLIEASDPNTFVWQFNSADQFNWVYTADTVTNNNLYNNFWKTDIEKRVNTQQRFVKCNMHLNESDIKIENFRKRIWIENQELGDAYYRLNKIVFPSDESKLSYVEMTNDPYYDTTWDPTIDISLYYYDGLTGKVSNVDPQEQPIPGTGSSYVYFNSIVGNSAVGGYSGETDYKTYSITFEWDIWAAAETRYFEDYNSSTTRLEYSKDGGGTWTTFGNVTATCYIYDDDRYEDSSGTTTVTGIENMYQFEVRAWWDYGQINNGGVYAKMTTATVDYGTVSVVCDDSIQGSGSSGISLTCI